MHERIFIIIPTYNYAHDLAVTLRNVLAQQDVRTEIIVVDDGSTDETAQAGASFGAQGQFSQGSSAARNLGMTLAQGDYVMFLDSDDLMMPSALRSQLDCLLAHPEADIAHCVTNLFTAPSPEAAPQPLAGFKFCFNPAQMDAGFAPMSVFGTSRDFSGIFR